MNCCKYKYWYCAAALVVLTIGGCATKRTAKSSMPQGDSRPTSQPIAGDPGASATIGANPSQADDKTAVLFDGSSWADWQSKDGSQSPWVLQDDGSIKSTGSDAVTNKSFGDFQLHLEFFCPEMPDAKGQARSNSGVYLHGRYEIQILDTFGLEPAGNGCGALYSIAPPMVNASRPPGKWQTYDIVFRAPRFDNEDKVTEQPRVTVMHNGIVIHNNLEVTNTTPGGIDREMVKTGPLLLQFHGDPVRYRNIWIRSLD